MLALIASQHGADLAASVAEAILHSPIRHHSEHQRMSLPARIGARHPKLVGIIEEMERNLEEPLSPSLLAKQAGSALGISERDQIFAQETHANRRAVILRELLAEQCGNPVAAEQASERCARSGLDAGAGHLAEAQRA